MKKLRVVGNVLIIIGFVILLFRGLFSLGYMEELATYKNSLLMLSYVFIILGASLYGFTNIKRNKDK